jgi:hypothetical protein
MKNLLLLFSVLTVLSLSSCKDDDSTTALEPVVYETLDQMGRPAINTVFNFFGSSDVKNSFNSILPSEGKAASSANFKGILNALQTYIFLEPSTFENILGVGNAALADVLSVDVVTCDLSKSPSSYATLNGRALDDDVIDVTLTLAFADQSEAGADNPVKAGVSTDYVGSNDKSHTNTFPYIATPH